MNLPNSELKLPSGGRSRYRKNFDRSESGFTMIELLMAMAVFLIVMAAIFGTLRTGVIMRDNINERSDITANARVSLNLIGREAVNAGLGYSRVGGIVADDFGKKLLGIAVDPGTDRDLFTGVIAGNDVNSSNISKPGEKNDVVAFVYRDLGFNGGNPVKITSASTYQNSAVLWTATNECVNCKAHDLYLVEAANGSQALGIATLIYDNRAILLGTGDPLGLNVRTDLDQNLRSILTPCASGETSNCFSYTPQGTVKKIHLVSYAVDDKGTLNRTTYGNDSDGDATTQIQVQPLAYNVQLFQVKYLLADGTKTDDPSEGNTKQSKMNDVVQVEIKLTIRAEGTKNGLLTTQIIDLSSSFSTRNLKYDVE